MEDDYPLLNDSCPATINTPADTEQELAILFLDIRNFTGLMESGSEQTMIQVLRRLFTTFNKIIRNFQGRIIEIAGDNLYAVFGLQTNLSEAVNQAYDAAKVMFQTLGLFNESYMMPHYGGPLEIGVGLHAGKVFVGEFGLNAPAQLSVMGLPVNIASRLQAKTKELNNDLLISEDAYRLLSADSTRFDQRTVHLQGVSYAQQIRLAGKPYSNNRYLAVSQPDLDYLIAISG